MSDRLMMMVNVLLSGVKFRDQLGHVYTPTGFKDDGKTVLMTRLDKPLGHTVPMQTLEGLEVVKCETHANDTTTTQTT